MATRTTTIALTQRDTELLEALTLRIRVLSIDQISRTWWPDSATAETANRRVRQLVDAGYLSRVSLMAHPETPVHEAVCVWTQDDVVPDFGAVAWRLNSRWLEPLINTDCVIATRFAGRFFGGYGGRKPRRAETTHDLHLSAVFLQMRTNQPRRSASWSSEEERKKAAGHGEKLPDAIVSDGKCKTAIELGGKSYDREKLEGFHKFCVEQNLSYEIW
ncbi:MAG: hypothetical protein ACI92S_001500 [Planctomycetaceae bacterium]|jgi:hypothetical protein